MATEFNLPELGEGIDGGDVIEVMVQEGADVEQGQTLLELETSKATIPVPAPQAGRVTKLHVKPGDHVKVGQALVTLDGAEQRGEKNTERPKAESAKPVPAEESKEKPPAKSDKQERDEPKKTAAKQREPAQNQSEQPEPADNGDSPDPMEPTEERPAGRRLAKAEQGTAPDPSDHEPVPAGPASRRLARELGVDIREVSGSGRGGRITESDVKAYVRDTAKGRRPSGEPLLARHAPSLPDFNRWGPTDREPLNAVRRTMAEQMSLAWSLIPHVTHCDEADIRKCEQLRKQYADRIAEKGAKLTITAIAVKAAAAALKRFPQFNASLDATSGELILKRYYHIGVAVDTERGLIVPVIRDADKRSVIEIALELTRLSERARARKIGLDDLQGGTFTVTNVGGLGGTSFTPIVNYPEVAILGMVRAREQPVVRNGQIDNRLMLPLCLSFDHRVIDGAAAARFTRHVAELLEEPFLMMLES